MRRRTPNISKIQQAIGYKPSYDIDAILRDVIAYFRLAKSASFSAETAAQKAAATNTSVPQQLHRNGAPYNATPPVNMHSQTDPARSGFYTSKHEFA